MERTASIAGCCGSRRFGGEIRSGVAGAAGGRDVDFLIGDGAVHADLTGGNAEGLIPEPEAGENVDGTHDADDDAGGDDDAPEWGAQGIFRGGGFVEVTQDENTDNDHKAAERDKAGAGGE